MPSLSLKPWTLQLANTAQEGRFHDGAFLQALSTTPNNIFRTGVLASVATNPNTTAVDLFTQQQASPNMSVLVSPGSAALASAGAAATRGPYIASSNSNVSVALSASNPTNPRIDVIYMQVIDTVAGDTGSSDGIISAVTGTPSGSPAVPALPTNGICIPLAQVLVTANATQILNAAITDVRKSAGIVGANRFMLPGDAISDPGFRYGELRCRTISSYLTNGVQTVLTEYWGADNKWHGLNDLYVASPTQTGFGSLGNGVTTTIASIAIPDPGYAYHVETSAMVDYSASAVGAGLLLSVNMDSTTYNTNAITQGHGSTPTASTSTDVNAYAPHESSFKTTPAGFTGAHTISLVAQGQGAGITVFDGINHGSGAGDKYRWLIKIVPA